MPSEEKTVTKIFRKHSSDGKVLKEDEFIAAVAEACIVLYMHYKYYWLHNVINSCNG